MLLPPLADKVNSPRGTPGSLWGFQAHGTWAGEVWVLGSLRGTLDPEAFPCTWARPAVARMGELDTEALHDNEAPPRSPQGTAVLSGGTQLCSIVSRSSPA